MSLVFFFFAGARQGKERKKGGGGGMKCKAREVKKRKTRSLLSPPLTRSLLLHYLLPFTPTFPESPVSFSAASSYYYYYYFTPQGTFVASCF